MIRFREIRESFLHLLFPEVCKGCGNDHIGRESELCARCIESLPETNFELHPDNPVEKMFWGRLPLAGATAQFYFTKESLMQRLLHLIKYKGEKALGWQMGRLMGRQLQVSGRFPVDALIPLPLFPDREKRRGYNQAMLLCEGIAKILQVPVIDDLIRRPSFTETQTKKGRIQRWKNMEGKFLLEKKGIPGNSHLLLVDDVVTTGATLEACGNELLKAGNLQLSIAALCIATTF